MALGACGRLPLRILAAVLLQSPPVGAGKFAETLLVSVSAIFVS